MPYFEYLVRDPLARGDFLTLEDLFHFGGERILRDLKPLPTVENIHGNVSPVGLKKVLSLYKGDLPHNNSKIENNCNLTLSACASIIHT